ncbi:MAG: ANTAR domain-containing protein [Clostridiales bacterium]|nr:ANTAR domain-containing protein [Clostridiales bacterium]
MNRILIVTGNEQSAVLIGQLLAPFHCEQIVTVSTCVEARRTLGQQTFDLIVINAPLSDEPGNDFAVHAAESAAVSVMLLVKHEYYEEICLHVSRFGVIVIPKPLNKNYFYQAVQLAEAFSVRILKLKDENLKLKNKIDDIRIVDRAKCTLVQYCEMTEQQAHRYIEKLAMDQRKTRCEIAQSILETYKS